MRDQRGGAGSRLGAGDVAGALGRSGFSWDVGEGHGLEPVGRGSHAPDLCGVSLAGVAESLSGAEPTVDFAHISLDHEALDEMFEVDLPTDTYYDVLVAHMRRRRPEADPLLLEHREVVEPIVDIAIVAGD